MISYAVCKEIFYSFIFYSTWGSQAPTARFLINPLLSKFTKGNKPQSLKNFEAE